MDRLNCSNPTAASRPVGGLIERYLKNRFVF